MPTNKDSNMSETVKRYVLNINENTIGDINNVPDRNKKGVEEIIAYKKQQLSAPKTYIINGKEVKDSPHKVRTLLKKLIKENPDLAYETKLNLLQISQVKYLLFISLILGIIYSILEYLVYRVFMPAYHLPELPVTLTVFLGATAGLGAYEIILKKKEIEFENLLLKGVVIDPTKEFKRQKINFILELIYLAPVLVLVLIIVEYAFISTVF